MTPPKAYFAKTSLFWAFLTDWNWCGKVIAERNNKTIWNRLRGMLDGQKEIKLYSSRKETKKRRMLSRTDS